MTNKKIPSIEQLEYAFQLVAYSSLKENGEPTDIENIEVEAARITRCVEYYYRIDDKVELDYVQFASKFLQDNFKEIVFGDKYCGFFLDDLPEGVEKECYMQETRILSY